MKVVHVSVTPLAGLPIRISKALNTYTDVKSRHVALNPNAYGTLTFPGDLSWEKDQEETKDLISQADILHFYHWFPFGSVANPFRFDFLSHLKTGAKYVMQWQTNPMTVAKNARLSVQDIVEAPVPQLVSAQFHESYYPHARPIPLIVDVEDNLPTYQQREKPVFFFSPSNPNATYGERWETKGRSDVLQLLDELKEKDILDYHLVERMPFDTCASLRSQADVVIDDLITGSFHLSSLEALALGKPTLSYLDSRTQMVLAEITGCTDLPIINIRLEDAKSLITELSQNRELREQIGQFSRAWMMKNYTPQKMIRHYVSAYETLLNGGTLNNPRYSTHATAKAWLYNKVPDYTWASRRELNKQTKKTK